MNILILTVGLVLTLSGLLFIAPQVNKHQIRPYSTAAWILRGGVVIIVLVMVFSLPERNPVVIQIGQIVGVTLTGASIIMVSHEWTQAGDLKHSDYQFKPSPDMLFFLISALLTNIILLIGLVQQVSWINVIVPLFSIWMFIFGIRLTFSKERERAGFNIHSSLSAQIFFSGMTLLILGTL
jgi:hypothetical protein